MRNFNTFLQIETFRAAHQIPTWFFCPVVCGNVCQWIHICCVVDKNWLLPTAQQLLDRQSQPPYRLHLLSQERYGAREVDTASLLFDRVTHIAKGIEHNCKNSLLVCRRHHHLPIFCNWFWSTQAFLESCTLGITSIYLCSNMDKDGKSCVPWVPAKDWQF